MGKLCHTEMDQNLSAVWPMDYNVEIIDALGHLHLEISHLMSKPNLDRSKNKFLQIHVKILFFSYRKHCANCNRSFKSNSFNCLFS